MPNWIREHFRDPQTSFASAVLIMSVVGLVLGSIGITLVFLGRQ